MGVLPVGSPALDFTCTPPKSLEGYAEDVGRNIRTRIIGH